jgi:hypothetical protein
MKKRILFENKFIDVILTLKKIPRSPEEKLPSYRYGSHREKQPFALLLRGKNL